MTRPECPECGSDWVRQSDMMCWKCNDCGAYFEDDDAPRVYKQQRTKMRKERE